jgi:Transcriptional regulator, AbiEi antitoxin, Type IV TA system
MEASSKVDVEAKFSDFLQSIGGSVESLEEPSNGPDFVFKTNIRGNPVTFIAECKAQGEPRYVRQGAEQLREYQAKYPAAYPIIIAPFITESTASLLSSKKVGYFDLAGNALIDFGPVFVQVGGKTQTNPVQRKLKSLFSPRSSRILRILLTDPRRRWLLRDLSKEAKVSIGLVSKVKEKLIELEFAAESRDVSITKPGELLDDWARNYSYSDNKIERYYSTLDPALLEKRLADRARERAWRYALTMFSGASKIESFVRYNFAAFYYSGPAGELAEELQLKAVPSGANAWVLLPRDEGVYWGTEQIADATVVSNVQLYLDLINFKGRGEEQATAIREQRLRY